MQVSKKYSYTTISVELIKPFIYHVILNRPKKCNAVNDSMFLEIKNCFNELSKDADCRVIILSGSGKMFCGGIDFESMISLSQNLGEQSDVGRRAKILFNHVQGLQQSVTALEICSKPVLVAIHSGCIGTGLDMVTACDIRYCTKDAWFEVKEVRLGLAADLGTLQRLPKIIGSDSLVRELCYTGRKLPGDEAEACGLVSKVFTDKETMMREVVNVAEKIASNSPIAVQVTKKNLLYSRDHAVQDGLENILTWNQLMLQSEDFFNTVVASANKDNTPVFYAKL